jgi:hypothetical protein
MNNRRRGWFKKGGQQPFSFFADEFPSTWGVSFRKLKEAWAGPCCRVQRVSDGATQTFGFVDNYVDWLSIETFLAGSNGRLFNMYDQLGPWPSGNNDLQQTNPALSPLIAVGGVVNRNANGHVYAQFDGVDDFMQNPQNNSNTTGTGTESLSAYSVWNSQKAAFTKGVEPVWTYGFREESTVFSSGVVSTIPSLAGFGSFIPGGTLAGPKILSIFYQPFTHLYCRRNGVDSPITVPGSTFRNATSYFYVNRNTNGATSGFNGQFMELIKRRGDNGSERVAIENQINNFYNCF